MSEYLAGLPTLEPGHVWLTGAGPGDPGLLTLHALNGLRQADVVVHDALVDERILALADARAEIVHAGKRGGRPSPKQPDISRRLVLEARRGRRVLRLKGGDPFVFGRGGEEALALVAAGVPFRIVPGITAGIGGLAYAGVPVTHRDCASAVTFVTGHDAFGDVPGGLDWEAIAKSPAIVLYMGLKTLGGIADRLMQHGRPAADAVVVASRATTRDQHVIETTLGSLAADVVAAGIEAPAITVIGETARLRQGLDWLGHLESGRRLHPDPLGRQRQARNMA